MYFARRPPLPATEKKGDDDQLGRRSWRELVVAPNVALLGVTSLITDTSSEMLAAVLPLYLTVHLGFTALQYGAIDGLLQLVTALTALTSALTADRWRRYREVAGVGYGASAASRLGLLAARGWLPTLGWLSADRVGKGVRTAPRDALISLSAPPGRMGEAFGLHRALDTGGALAGPLAAVALLSVAPGSYQTVFVASFLIALVGLGVLWLFVENRQPLALARHGQTVWQPLATLWSHRPLRRVLVAATLLSIPAVSDAFLFLTLRRQVGLDQRWFPILFVGESAIYLIFAWPFGRLADRVGAGRVLLGGQVALGLGYALLLTSPARIVVVLALPACLGLFFAATDGVLASLASQAVPPLARTTGLAVVAVVVAAGRAVAATGYGTVWHHYGPHRAVTVALGSLAVGAVLATVVLAPFLSPHVSLASAPTGGSCPAGTAAPEIFDRAAGRRRRLRWRLATFVTILAVTGAGIVAVTWRGHHNAVTASRASSAHLASIDPRQAGTPAGELTVPLTAALDGLVSAPHLLVLDTATGDNFTRLEVVDAANPGGPRASTPLSCDRVDFRGGRGVCLSNGRVGAVRGIYVFDDHFNVLFRLGIAGMASRTRIAPDGHIAAVTVFVAGDSYAVDSFSTRTTLIDLVKARVIADLESFTITQNGRRFYAIDENFWGVTFAADSDTFYATLRTGGHHYLIRGHANDRQGEILRDGVECPAISPDGGRLAYKSRIYHGFDPATWQLRVLDLATLADHPLAEARNVDDQAAWLDDTHIVYGVQGNPGDRRQTDTWSVPTDGTGTPVLLVPTGVSPVPASP